MTNFKTYEAQARLLAAFVASLPRGFRIDYKSKSSRPAPARHAPPLQGPPPLSLGACFLPTALFLVVSGYRAASLFTPSAGQGALAEAVKITAAEG